MRIVVMVLTGVLVGAAGAAGGYFLGEYFPGGIAALGAPFSQIRDAEAAHYALIGGLLGAFLGIVLGGVVRLSSADERRVGTAPGVVDSRGNSSEPKNDRETQRDLRRWVGAAMIVVGLAVCCLAKPELDTPVVAAGVVMWAGLTFALPFHSALLRATLGLALASVVTITVVAVMGGNRRSAAPAPSNSQTRVSPDMAPVIGLVQFDELWNAYMTDEAGADARYRDRRAVFVARVTAVRRSEDGDVLLFSGITDGSPSKGAGGFLPPSKPGVTAVRGALVVLDCEVSGRMNKFVQMNLCVDRTRERDDGASARRADTQSEKHSRDASIKALSEDSAPFVGRTLTLRGYRDGGLLCDRPCDTDGVNSVDLHDPDGKIPHGHGLIKVRVEVGDDGSLTVVD